MRRDRLLVLVLIAATGICLYLCYLIASPFLSALAWALALAIITHPLHRWISRRIRHPNIAATLSVLLIAIVILGPVVFVTHNLVQQATASAEQIKAASADGLLKLIARTQSPGRAGPRLAGNNCERLRHRSNGLSAASLPL